MYNITDVAPTRPVGPENGERDRLPDGSFPENIKVRSIDGKVSYHHTAFFKRTTFVFDSRRGS